MTQHTPGPWMASGDLIIGGHYVPSNPTAKSGYYEIAKVISQGKPGLYPWQPDYATYEANSRLIEAAPDLLVACKALQMEAAARGCGLKIADDAIAKATQSEVSA